MPTSVKREERPTALLNPDTMAQLGLADGDLVRIGNERGSVVLHVKARPASTRPRSSSRASGRTATGPEGIGVNLLLSADPAPPNGGAVIHDTAVWLEPVVSRGGVRTDAVDLEPSGRRGRQPPAKSGSWPADRR